MAKYLLEKVVRIRCKKAYPDAHSHVIMGKVLEETNRYLVVKGRSFHFKRIVDCMKSQVKAGDSMIRILPWDNIEIIHPLNERTDCSVDFEFDPKGNLVLKDKAKTLVATQSANED